MTTATAPAIAPYEWLPAAPFRAHFRSLVDQTGLPWRAVAVALDVPALTAARLVAPRRSNDRIRRVDAVRTMSATARELRARQHEVVSAEASCTVVRRWLRAGASVAEIAECSGVSRSTVVKLAWSQADECTLRVAWRLRAARDEALARPMASLCCTGAQDPLEAA